MRTETIVLGAGIIGVSVGLHLLERGQSVTIIDRSSPGEGASFGNAGLIERCSVIPYAIPRDILKLLHFVTNRSVVVRYQLAFLPHITPWLMGYWKASHPDRLMTIARQLLPLLETCIDEHERLMHAAGLLHLVRHDGWVEIVRSQKGLAQAAQRSEIMRRDYGLASQVLDKDTLTRLEPCVKAAAIGGIHWHDPLTVDDPSALTKGYAAYFEKMGGSILRETIQSIEPQTNGWRIRTDLCHHDAANVVVALGAHSAALLAMQGYRLPLVGKRGYHLHFRPEDGVILKHAILDEEIGYVMAPMNTGIRLTTGVELAAPTAPANHIQISRAQKRANEIFPLGNPVEKTPWLGLRPAMPDMKPVIGPAPNHRGLWLAFGHAHHGLTLGPSTGRLLAEIMTGEKPFADPTPFSIKRFL